jgi:FtsH-binding integral membrane protein
MPRSTQPAAAAAAAAVQTHLPRTSYNQGYVRTNRWPFWTAWGLAIALMLVLACVEKARRVYPMNMLLLGAFTVAQAFLVGMISAYYNIEVRYYNVLLSMGLRKPCPA